MKLHSISSLRNRVILFTCLLTLGHTYAQSLSKSPYGRFGMGDWLPNGNAWSQGLGGTSLANSDSSVLNFDQPAALAGMARGTTLFQAGVQGDWVQYRSDFRKTQGTNAGYNHLALAFPIIRKYWFFGFQMRPVAVRGFTLLDSLSTTNEGKTMFSYSGTGGFSNLQINNAVQVYRDLSIGISTRYWFGKSDYYTDTYFAEKDDQFWNSRITGSQRLSDIDFQFGLQFQHRFHAQDYRWRHKHAGEQTTRSLRRDSIFVKIGLMYTPSTALRAYQSRLAESIFSAGGSGTVRDTIINESDTEGSIVIPSSLGAGITVGSSNQRWLVTADYLITNGSEFRMFGNPDSMRNSFRVAMGIQWTPKPDMSHGGLKHSSLRLGAYYSDGILQVNGQKIPEMGISLGWGLPVVLRTYYGVNARSMMNLSITGGQRGKAGVKSLQEQFVRVGVSFSLSDRWFVLTRFN